MSPAPWLALTKPGWKGCLGHGSPVQESSSAVQRVQQLCLAAQAALSHGLAPATLWQEVLAPHGCQAALLHQETKSQQAACQAAAHGESLSPAETGWERCPQSFTSHRCPLPACCSEPDAPTFYFLVVTLPTDYYGPVEVAWSSAGSATDAEGNQLTPPQPLTFTRTQAEPLASSCVFELISPATQTA